MSSAAGNLLSNTIKAGRSCIWQTQSHAVWTGWFCLCRCNPILCELITASHRLWNVENLQICAQNVLCYCVCKLVWSAPNVAIMSVYFWRYWLRSFSKSDLSVNLSLHHILCGIWKICKFVLRIYCVIVYVSLCDLHQMSPLCPYISEDVGCILFQNLTNLDQSEQNAPHSWADLRKSDLACRAHLWCCLLIKDGVVCSTLCRWEKGDHTLFTARC